jgi:Arm DNA-binding domain
MKRSWVQIPLRAWVRSISKVRLSEDKLCPESHFSLSICRKICAVMTGLWDVPTHKIAHIMNAKIWIEPTGKTLRLVWYYEGKRHRLSIGIPDNSIGRALAAKKMAEIKIDLESGYYDPTLLKYRPRKLGANPTELTAVELFEKYTSFVAKEAASTQWTST